MSHVPMVFAFPESRSATLAYEMLAELGYHVHQARQDGGQPCVQVFMESTELSSAMEVAQAYGGQLVEFTDDMLHAHTHDHEHTHRDHTDAQSAVTGGQLYESAYGMDMIPIPAHLVNESDPGDYDYEGRSSVTAASHVPPEAEQNDFDPSGHDYDGFDAGVHL
ncbi:hypothetical protein [Paenibacillus koleovorans]|uniref:hypothetical protein n=1 Tax=Paenibacillus koleovorans TaxID=121608 RepID=UPI000FDAFD21|nr:hypothetical protein [Paenibacillus koleovorans]